MQKILIVFGLVALLVGLAWPWLSSLPLGRLPGDIVIERENVRVYIPLASMVILSLVVSALAWLFRG